MIEDDLISQTTFGEFLRFLRRRARMTQRQLGVALDYSVAMVARLESGERTPDVALVKTTYIEALGLKHAPELAARLIELAATARAEARPTPAPILPPTPRTTTLSNLPVQLTRFIGRERETAEVACLLNMSRLVTLTGSGGVGKTRLALEVGSSFVESRTACVPVLPTPAPNERPHRIVPPAPPFPDGIWLAELAPFADPALIPQTAAAALHVPEQPGHPHLETLIAYLNDKHLLLILDNCEHLVDACAQLVESLLRSCPHVRILTTSRESLRVAGEVVWRVPPMATPDPAYLPPLSQVLDYDAIALFIQTATAVEPGLTLTPDDMNAIARICWRLDGIPLAIEMAAGQVAALPVRDVAAGLDDRFSLLQSGRRTALPRQQTLRATLDWSYDLLDEQERILLARLAVFEGGWTIDAAKAVCGDATNSVLTASDLLPVLLRLVHKSLVVSMMQDGRARYRFLETVRQYAREHLQERGEWRRVGACHLGYYLALAEETMDLGGRHVDAWVRRIDPEYDNLRAAFAWARGRDDRDETALRLAAALRPYWLYRSHTGEAMSWLDAVLVRGGTASVSTRARALLAKASLCINWGDPRGSSVGAASLALFRQTDDRAGTAWCLELLANFHYYQAPARVVADEAPALPGELGSQDDEARAQVLAEEALSLFQELGSLDGVGRALKALGTAAYRSGAPAKAVQLFEQAIAADQEVGDRWDILACLYRLYDANPMRALELCEQELAHRRLAGDEEHTVAILERYGVLLVAEGEYERAKRVLEVSVQWWQHAAFFTKFYFFALMGLGFTELSLGHCEPAIGWWAQARKLAGELGDSLGRYVAQFLITSAMIAQGNRAVATGEMRECLRKFQQHDWRPGVVCALIQMADLAQRRGNLQRAAGLLGAARAFGYEVEAMKHWFARVPWRWHQDAQRSVVEPTLTAVRAILGDAEFEAAYVAGQHMTLDQAVAYALAN